MKNKIMKISIYIIGVLLICCWIIITSFSKYDKNLNNNPEFIIDTLATSLVVPWEISFLPDKTMLFTERNGKVRIYRDNKLLKRPALEINNIETKKKMGLLGIAVHPDFPKKNYVYLAYNYKKGENTFLRVARYRFKKDSLINPEIIVENIEASQNHTGSRLLFGPEDHLFITTGDADHASYSQDLDKLNGKILRLNDDGTIPDDNPFVGIDSARPEIWTYGHRNTQGLAFQPETGLLFNSEHGPSGGDEINIIKKGENYGWPFIHHKDQKEGMNSPFLEYTPSIGPSKILFYNSNVFQYMKGDLLLATLRGENILQLRFEGGKIKQRKLFENGKYGRIRAITVGPDGYIYFSTSQVDPPEGTPGDNDDMLLRLRPGRKIDHAEFEKSFQPNVTKKSSRNSQKLYKQLCLSCHGSKLQGTNRGPSLIDDDWIYGKNISGISKIIRDGAIDHGMPAWNGVLNNEQIKELSAYILKFN